MPTEFTLDPADCEFIAIRAQGPGGQNINKVSNAVQLRFDIAASSLPDAVKARLGQFRDHRISADGIIVIKAQRFRSLEQNREDALARLRELLAEATRTLPPRHPTRPTRASQRRRVEGKARHGELKRLRGKIHD